MAGALSGSATCASRNRAQGGGHVAALAEVRAPVREASPEFPPGSRWRGRRAWAAAWRRTGSAVPGCRSPGELPGWTAHQWPRRWAAWSPRTGEDWEQRPAPGSPRVSARHRARNTSRENSTGETHTGRAATRPRKTSVRCAWAEESGKSGKASGPWTGLDRTEQKGGAGFYPAVAAGVNASPCSAPRSLAALTGFEPVPQP